MLIEAEHKRFDSINKGPIHRSLFSNGAVLLQHSAPGFSGAKVNLNFLAGSMFEKKSEHGIAHLIEHLLFKETDSDILRRLELQGAQVNAYTYKENVCFEMSCMASKLKYLLPLFLEMFLTLDFSKEQLEKEKRVIIQELIEDKEDHETQGLEFIFNKNFPEDLGHPIGGGISQIKNYTQKNVLDFYHKYFKAERMILSLGGGFLEKEQVSFKKIFKTALEQFFPIKDKAPYRFKTLPRVAKLEHSKSRLKRQMESAIVFYSFDGPSANSKSYYDYLILDELLFEGLCSPFFKKFREEKALVYGLSSSVNSFGKYGNYIMAFNSQNENIVAIRKGVLEVLDSLLEQLTSQSITMNDISLIKNRMIDSWEIAFDSIDERVDYIGESEMYQLHETGLSQVKKQIESVTQLTLVKLLKKMYKKSEYTELILLKK